MKAYIWVIVFLIAAVGTIATRNVSIVGAIGFNVPFFILGIILSPIWWAITKFKRKSSWKWYDWLNVSSYIMIVIKILGVFLKGYVQSNYGV